MDVLICSRKNSNFDKHDNAFQMHNNYIRIGYISYHCLTLKIENEICKNLCKREVIHNWAKHDFIRGSVDPTLVARR